MLRKAGAKKSREKLAWASLFRFDPGQLAFERNLLTSKGRTRPAMLELGGMSRKSAALSGERESMT
jgi:hypothetical protein